MDLAHAGEMPWGESLVAQRGATAGMAHKRLFEGEEASPDNYMLVMSREPSSYFSPRHRHPWDQIRYCLEGEIPISRGLSIEGGEIGYFPESAPYGPQEGGKDRIVLLLQFGGASGQGFIGPDRLKLAQRELEATGRFEKGVYSVEDGAKRTNRDAYEALWHHVTGAPPAYVPPAYKAPIVMRPEALAWQPAGAGVACRRAGIFPHRPLALTFWKLDPGASHDFAAGPALRFLFVTLGEGRIEGQELRRWSTVRLQPGEDAPLSSEGGMEVLEIEVGLVARSSAVA